MSSYDIRLTRNFKMFVCGPSRCGKTVFIAKLLENISVFAKSPPEKVIYVYKIWQSLFDDFTTQGLVHVFLQDQEEKAKI